jgi:hypothetical protein
VVTERRTSPGFSCGSSVSASSLMTLALWIVSCDPGAKFR